MEKERIDLPKFFDFTKTKDGQKKNYGRMEIKNVSEEKAELNIYGDIVSDEWGKWTDDDTCPSDVHSFLQEIGEVAQLDIHINSGGGSVFGGIAICNQLKQHKAKKTVYIDGIAASIASVIACAGDEVVVYSNSTYMVHKPSNGYFLESLNADQLRKDAEILDRCQEAILNTYMPKVKQGVTRETIDKLINEETWLTGHEITEYFDFKVQEENKAEASSSDFYQAYKRTPKSLSNAEKQQSQKNQLDQNIIKATIKEVIAEMQEEHFKKEKEDLLKDLDQYGV